MHDAQYIVLSVLRVSIVQDYVCIITVFAFVNDNVVVPVRSLVLVMKSDCMHYLVHARRLCL